MPWSFVAKMEGLCADCTLCNLFVATILPNTYSAIPTRSPWHLRALCVKYSSIQNQDKYYFQGIPRVALYAGSQERDFFKFFDSDRARERGLLFAARAKDLQEYASIARDQQLPRTQFTPPKYSADLVRRWVEFSSSAEDGLTDSGDDDESQQTDTSSCVEPTTNINAIDCETLQIVNLTTEMEYIALSYVWRLANNDLVPSGHSMYEDSNTRSADTFLPPLIPRVVHNAITVVLDLGYRYLWVDQFCIDQSAPRVEINEHISKMDIIYSSAQLTIIAASTHGALPGVGTTQRIPQIVLDLGSLTKRPENDITLFTTNPGIQNAILESVWFTRGWCFQEATLSPRRLYFTDHEMYFDAENMWCSDSYPEPDFMEDHILCWEIHGELSLVVHSWEEFLEDRNVGNQYELDDPRGTFWVEMEIFLSLVQEYLGKEMTLDDDVINGFKGVMKVFSRQDSNFQTLQGLPVFELPYLFRPEYIESGSTVENIARSETSCPTSQQDEYREFRKEVFVNVLRWHHDSDGSTRRAGFPSWSWAGWKGMPSWDYMPKNINGTHHEMGEARLDIQAIESVSGKVLNFDEELPYFSQDTDDPMFLIGEAIEIPRYRLMERHTFHELFQQSRVTRFQKKARSISRQCVNLSNRVWHRPRRVLSCHETTIDKPRKLSKIFPLSRLTKCFARDTWHITRWHLDSPEVLGSTPRGSEHQEISQRLDDGTWSYLLMNEVPGRADLLIVSWEKSSVCEPKIHNGRELRTCSRVGVAEILNDSQSGRLFSDDHSGLPTAYFRLG